MLTTRRPQAATPLVPPVALMERLPLTDSAADFVAHTRQAIVDILQGLDDRLIVVVGPCSIHDPFAAIEYAHRLRVVAEQLAPELQIVMRVYCEKPRTTIGWKGLIHDPHLDGSGAIDDGLFVARKLLLRILDLRVPVGCEFLDPMAAVFIADAVSWGSIGARTSESPIHRQLASELPMPVGFKNGTLGNLQVAIDAMVTASHPHRFMTVDALGRAALVRSPGNPDCHVVLRGGPQPNHDASSVRTAGEALLAAGLPPRVMIDASHGNSGKDHRRQQWVARDIASQVADGDTSIRGIMLESFLVAGRHERASAVFGQSITDACLGWETTFVLLHELAASVRARRGYSQLLSRQVLIQSA
jgi:3-deoxy-7-phosphoheptulonate synthase